MNMPMPPTSMPAMNTATSARVTSSNLDSDMRIGSSISPISPASTKINSGYMRKELWNMDDWARNSSLMNRMNNSGLRRILPSPAA